jgi:hypothetical protein
MSGQFNVMAAETAKITCFVFNTHFQQYLIHYANIMLNAALSEIYSAEYI